MINKIIFKIILVVLFLSSCASTNKETREKEETPNGINFQNVIYWSPTKQIEISDFQGSPKEEDYQAVNVFLETIWDNDSINSNIVINLNTVFYKDSKIDTNMLLISEQKSIVKETNILFDLQEVATRKLADSLSTLSSKSFDLQWFELQEVIYSSLADSKKELLDIFNKECNIEMSDERIRYWKHKADSLLHLYQKYEKGVVKIPFD